MANRNTVGFGLNATGTMGSNYTNQGQSNYFIDAADATAIYNGQAVKITGGYIVTASAGITNSPLGVLNGVFYNATSTQKPTWNTYYPGGITPANSEDTTAFVLDNPFQLFEIATDSAITQAGFMETYNMNAVSGNNTTEQSTNTLDIDGQTHATNYSWRVVRLAEDPSNSDITAAYCSVIVQSNLNEFLRKL